MLNDRHKPSYENKNLHGKLEVIAEIYKQVDAKLAEIARIAQGSDGMAPELERAKEHSALEAKIIAELERIAEELASTEDNSREVEAMTDLQIISKVRARRLESLAECILDVAHKEDDLEYIDVDDFEDLTALDAHVLDAIEREGGSAHAGVYDGYFARIGETLGTNDFLEILVPTYLTDKSSRALYFLPRERNDVKMANPSALVEPEDGSAYLYLPTGLPNMIMTQYYSPGSDMPKRFLHLPHVIIPPSSLQ